MSTSSSSTKDTKDTKQEEEQLPPYAEQTQAQRESEESQAIQAENQERHDELHAEYQEAALKEATSVIEVPEPVEEQGPPPQHNLDPTPTPLKEEKK